VTEAQAIKMAWSLLDVGPHDEGGLQNNLPVHFEVWFADAVDLHQDKVIKVVSSPLTKYGFTYYRIKNIERMPDLHYKLTCQAYNETYMDAFETDISPPPGVVCSIDSDCPAGYRCINGQCVPVIFYPPVCKPTFGGDITLADGIMRVPIEPCV
jgi:hypothetical protein